MSSTSIAKSDWSADKNMCKLSNRSLRKMCEICSKIVRICLGLQIRRPRRHTTLLRYLCCPFSADFLHYLHYWLWFLLITKVIMHDDLHHLRSVGQFILYGFIIYFEQVLPWWVGIYSSGQNFVQYLE